MGVPGSNSAADGVPGNTAAGTDGSLFSGSTTLPLVADSGSMGGPPTSVQSPASPQHRLAVGSTGAMGPASAPPTLPNGNVTSGSHLGHVNNSAMHKASNFTDDSGRGSQLEHYEASNSYQNSGFVDDGSQQLPNMADRRDSSQDQTGHLQVPSPGSTSNVSTSAIDTQIQSGSNLTPLEDTSIPQTALSSPTTPNLPDTASPEYKSKHAPKIIYSHSEDRLTTTTQEGSRPIIPGLPYSPYNSPQSSPRLRR